MSARKRRKRAPVLAAALVLIAVGLCAYILSPAVKDGVDSFLGAASPLNGKTPNQPADNAPQSGESAQGERKNTVYDILGESKDLDAQQWGNMLAMRYDAKKLAIKNPAVYLNGQPDSKSVCLTFDDGPDAEINSKIIDVLDTYNVKGNFFFVGKNVAQYPEAVKKAFNGGHLVACHSYSHADMTKLNAGGVKPEIVKTNDEIERLSGKRPLLVRPPYGAVNDDVISAISSGGYKTILWSIDTLDWLQKDPENITNNVLNNIRPGDIVLMHSSSDTEATLKALPKMIEALTDKGYNITTLDKLLNTDAYK